MIRSINLIAVCALAAICLPAAALRVAHGGQPAPRRSTPRSARPVAVRMSRLPAVQVAPEALAPGVPQVGTGPATLRLSLFEAMEMGLSRNPDLQALRRNEGVSRGMLGVAQTYPWNPYIQVQATPLQSSPDGQGPGTTYDYVLLMQQIQLAHQQRYRTANAAAALTSVRWTIMQAELTNVAMTERLFFTALYQKEIRDLALLTARMNAQVLRVAESQLEAGQAAGADVAIIRMDASSSRRQAHLAEAIYKTALLDLRRQINVPLNVPLEPIGRLTDWDWRAAPVGEGRDASSFQLEFNAAEENAIAALVGGRPDVMAARADLAAARANANLARAMKVPDLQIGPYYQKTQNGTAYYGFRAHTDLMIWNNGQPLVRQREAEVRQRMAVWQQLNTRAQIEAQTAIDRYERARRITDESRADFSEDLPVAIQRLENQFRAGEVDVIRIVTARTSLINLRRAHLDTLNELAQATAAVTLATGLPAERLIEMPLPGITKPAPTLPDLAPPDPAR